MARDVNWWLTALAFLLGLGLTLALMIRKVTREVPVGRTVEVSKPHLNKPHLDKPDVAKVAGAVTATGTAAAAGAAAKLHGVADKVAAKAEQVEQKVAAKAEHVEHKVAAKAEHVEHKVAAKAEHVEHKVAAKAEHVEHKVAANVEDAKKKVEDAKKTFVEKVDRVREGDIIEAAPYGSGSIRVSARRVGPAGYTIKGDKDTGRYFTSDSPDYDEIEAEVWFANEESAAKAGFLRWDAKGARAVGFVGAEAATVITEGEHVVAETVISETHAGDSTLVIVDDGIAEAKTVIVDDGIPVEEARIRIIGADD